MPEPKTDLTDSIVLITGANGDIGKAIATVLEADGAKVLRSDLEAPEGAGEDFLVLDVGDEASWKAALDTIEERHGALDVLVNNAGIAPMGPLGEQSLDTWRLAQKVNVEGPMLGMKLASPLLAKSAERRKGGASIVNMCSGASDKPTAFSAAYCTSKAAARMLTRVAAVEFATLGQKIRVNSVHPGVVASRMMDQIVDTYAKIMGDVDREELAASIGKGNPMGRYVTPEEVAEAVRFLASPQSSFVHGDAVHVDGGYAAS